MFTNLKQLLIVAFWNDNPQSESEKEMEFLITFVPWIDLFVQVQMSQISEIAPLGLVLASWLISFVTKDV